MNTTLQHHSTDPLRTAHAVVVGLGGLGCPAVRVLAAAGIGRLTLWDSDEVERSNLPRQLLYAAGDLGCPKAEVAAAWVDRHHPEVETTSVLRRFGHADARALRSATVVLDGTDSIESKFAVSDAAVAAGTPLVHAGATGLVAQLTTILPGATACYRCIFEAPPPPDDVPACAEAGVLAPFVNLVGGLQAFEALRIASGAPPAWAGTVLTLDVGRGRSRLVPVRRRHDCSACASRTASLPTRSEP